MFLKEQTENEVSCFILKINNDFGKMIQFQMKHNVIDWGQEDKYNLDSSQFLQNIGVEALPMLFIRLSFSSQLATRLPKINY